MTAKGETLRNLSEIARERGRSVGIVTTGELIEPGIAAFYAHHPDALESEQVLDQLLKARIDLIFGGGSAWFKPAEQGGRRKDGRDLTREITTQGNELLQSKSELENAAAFRKNRVVGLFATGALAYSDDMVSGSEQPSLGDMVRRAIEFLQVNRKGYLLVVDAALASHAADANAGERTLNETVAFDRALAIATKYAGDESLIIAVGKHAIGGLTLNGFPARQDHGVALLGTNASGHPSLTWSTGPNGPGPGAPPQANIEPAAFQTPSALETAEDVVAVGRGDGAEKLRGFIDNTKIFEIVRDAL
jgi:alkaline phosphatase